MKQYNLPKIEISLQKPKEELEEILIRISNL